MPQMQTDSRAVAAARRRRRFLLHPSAEELASNLYRERGKLFAAFYGVNKLALLEAQNSAQEENKRCKWHNEEGVRGLSGRITGVTLPDPVPPTASA